MRFTLITCFLLGFLAIASTQDIADRRERLRRLISAARGGDVEARKSLQGLRKQIELRRSRNKGTSAATTRVTFAPTTQRPTTEPAPVEVTTFHRQTPAQIIVKETPSRTVQRFREAQPIVEPVHRFKPHTTLHQALEVDDRSEMFADIRVTNRTKTPVVQTTRRYSYYDEAGNYIFGYEATDGSFKEEIRGTNCIVNGKYGYVDPTGVRRVFTYTSGNRCDINTPNTDSIIDGQNQLAPNDQFLVQTEERQLDDAALKKLVFNRRRQPSSRTRQRSQPQQEFTPRIRERPSSRPSTFPTPRPISAATAPPQTIAETEQPTTRVVITKAPTTKAPVVFRPTPRPIERFNFNFDQEFKNIFRNFNSNPVARPQPRPIPSLFSQPQLPVGRSKILSHFSQPPLPGVSFKPKSAPAQRAPTPAQRAPTPAQRAPTPAQKAPVSVPAPAPRQPQKIAHQLVFNAETGTFTTVPLSVPISGSNFRNTVQAPKKPVLVPLPASTGRPLQPTGFNPLPSIPIGGLSFHNTNTAREFDHFFNQFKL